MLYKYKRLFGTNRVFPIIYNILKYSNVSEKQISLISLISLIRTNRINRIIRIIEDVLAATSIFAIGYLWLLAARGFGWH